MPEYLIGRVSVVDEVTGEHTPIDARTRAEAVSTDEGKTTQEKINELNEHISNLAIHSTAYIKTIWQVTIPIDGWVLEAPKEDDFPYSLTMEYSGVLETHNAEVTIDNESIRVATACGLCPTMETLHNGFKFWSRTIPTTAILCHMTLFGEGGISGGGEPEPPAGYAFLTDENGNLLLDEEGAYLVDREE